MGAAFPTVPTQINPCLKRQHNIKSYVIYRMGQFSMTFNNPYHISRARHYSTLNISETTQDRDDFSLIYGYVLKTVVFSAASIYTA